VGKRSLVKALVKDLFDLINPLTIAHGLPDNPQISGVESENFVQ
jgi:hypothetical protein